MIVRVQLWLSRTGMESSCHLLTFLCKPFISGDLLCRSPPGGQEDPGPQTREQVQGLVPEIRVQTKAAQVISGTSQDTMGSLVALLRLTFLSISRGFSFGFYLVLLYFSFLFLLLCLRLKGLKYAKHVVYHRAAIHLHFFSEILHEYCAYRSTLSCWFLQKFKVPRSWSHVFSMPACRQFTQSHVSSLGSTRISWLQANVLGYLLFPNSAVPKSWPQGNDKDWRSKHCNWCRTLPA